jgi:hypothetical protein
MSDTALSVLVHRHRGPRPIGLDALWEEVRRRSWIVPSAPRIVIQVDQQRRSPLVVETARSLAAFVGGLAPSARVEIADAAAEERPSRAADVESAVTVAGMVAHSLRLPAWWFESCVVITVAGVEPDAVTRLSSALDAQAEPLRALNPLTPLATLAYEAHRLFASDLVVACATCRRDDPSSDACWFVSPNDVAVEMALARSSGGDPAEMPSLKMIAQHEILPHVALEQAIPMLSGYVAPAWQAKVHAARNRIATTRHAIVQDVVAVRRNLRRIPPAIRRRLAARKRGAG